MCEPFTTFIAAPKNKHRLLAQPFSFFENIWKQFSPDDAIMVGLAEHEGDVIAGSFYLLWGGVWYYKSARRSSSALRYAPTSCSPGTACASPSRAAAAPTTGVSATSIRPVSSSTSASSGPSNALSSCCATRLTVTRTQRRPKRGRCSVKLTGLLTRDDVPDDVTQRAGEILYRYFT